MEEIMPASKGKLSIETIQERIVAKEEVARQILRMTNSSVKLEDLGAVRVCEIFQTAVAGVALSNGITPEKAETLLLARV